jgi:cystathionine beta-lyase/cystathionine gamma-synthase
LDESIPQYELAKKQMNDACGLLTIVLKVKNRAEIVKFCESLQHIMMAVSWGGHESLVIPKCTGIRNEDFDANNPEHRYIRMYVGLEDADYLKTDLSRALDRIN